MAADNSYFANHCRAITRRWFLRDCGVGLGTVALAQMFLVSGAQQFGRPSLGSWVVYGLGSESRDLPAFVAFSSGSKGPSSGNSCFGSGFLPSLYGGTLFRSGGEPVLYLANPPG